MTAALRCMKRFTDWEIPYPVLPVLVIAKLTTKIQALEVHLSALETIQAEFANYLVLFTMATPTLGIQVKIGVQVQTGPVCLGRMLKDTFQEIHPH